MRRRLLILPVLGLCWTVACGDDGGDDGTGGIPDGGTASDTGPTGPDMDGDRWLDDEDNCPAIANPEQRDRDDDGIGNLCDSCPATPNAQAEAEDDPCLPVDEQEPNDAPAQAQAIAFAPMGQFREVRGTVEAPRGGAQSFDRFALEAEAGQLVRIRVARADSDSRLEPAFEVTGPDYAARSAGGRFIAEREIYFPRAGTYQVAVGDRRGLFGDTPRGSDEDTYALSIRELDVQTRSVEVGPSGFEDRTFAFDDPDAITILESTLETGRRFSFFTTKTELGRGESEFGLDTLLVVELGDDEIHENDDVGPGVTDSQLLLEDVAADTPVRIVLDHARRVGPDDLEYEVELTVVQYEILPELEPNDEPDIASPLQFPDPCARGARESTSGGIEMRASAADTDWYTFMPKAGDSVFFEVTESAGNFQPDFEIAELRGDTAQTVYRNAGDRRANITMIFPEEKEYLVRVDHGPNLDPDNAPTGGPLFTYRVQAECIGATNAGTIAESGTRLQRVAPGDTSRWGLAPIEVVVADVLVDDARLGADPNDTTAPEIVPQIEIFGQGGVGLLTRGLGEAGGGRAAVILDVPNPDPQYLFSVINPSGFRQFAYEAAFELEPVVPFDEIAEEPNNRFAEASVVTGLPVGVQGRIRPDDPDFVRFTSDGSQLDIFANAGGNTLGLVVFDAAGEMVTSDPIRILAFAEPAGDYVIRITSSIETDYELVVTDTPDAPPDP